MNVKSSVVTKEEVTVARGGKIVDERSRETKENNSYSSTTSEIWEPIGVIQRQRNLKPFDSSDESRPNSNASSDQGYTSSNNVPRTATATRMTNSCSYCGSTGSECAKSCCLQNFNGLRLNGGRDETDGDACRGASKVQGVHTTTSAVR